MKSLSICGLTLDDGTVYMDTHDLIVRYLRVHAGGYFASKLQVSKDAIDTSEQAQ